MAVYARGYRPYEGPLRGRPAAWTIFREAYRTAMRTVAMRRLRTMALVIFAAFALILYTTIGLRELIPSRRPGQLDPAAYSWETLRNVALSFYLAVMFLQALVAILGASGLVSDDLRTRALPLYLVRPMRPVDYVLGKALLLPGILFWISFLPGFLFLTLVSLWQPPGGSWSFFRAHADFLLACAQHFLVASAAYTGLTLLVSSQTARRGTAAGLTAAAIFGGAMLQTTGRFVEGAPGAILRTLGIPQSTLSAIVDAAATGDRRSVRLERGLPESEHAILFALLLLALGLFFTWRRARSVEVSG